MKAITVEPRNPGTARLEEVPEPGPSRRVGPRGGRCRRRLRDRRRDRRGQVRLGSAGQDAPRPRPRVARARDGPGPGGGLKKGDLVVGIVRRPDPVPCPNCAVGEWDMCRNGQYTERGIKEIHGFMSERWRIEPEYAMKVDRSLGLLGVLLEPTTVVAKAWEQVSAVGQRSFWEPRTVLVTGAGPIGLLAAFLAAQHGLDVHVLDRVTSGPKPELVRALGATYHSGSITDVGFEPDVILECTGVGQVIADSIQAVARGRRRLPHRRRERRARRRRCRSRTWRPTWSSGTTSSSGALTRTSGTGTGPERRWRARTGRGSARLITRREAPERFRAGSRTPARRHQGRRPVLRGVTREASEALVRRILFEGQRRRRSFWRARPRRRRPRRHELEASRAPLRVYVGTYTGGASRGIYRFELDASSGAVVEGPVLAGRSENPSFLPIHPGGRFLYAVNEVRTSAANPPARSAPSPWTRRRETSPSSTRRPSGGGDPATSQSNAEGRYLVVANYSGGSVAVLPARRRWPVAACRSRAAPRGVGTERGAPAVPARPRRLLRRFGEVPPDRRSRIRPRPRRAFRRGRRLALRRGAGRCRSSPGRRAAARRLRIRRAGFSSRSTSSFRP